MFPVNSAFLYRLGHSDMVFVFKGLPYLRLVDGPRWAVYRNGVGNFAARYGSLEVIHTRPALGRRTLRIYVLEQPASLELFSLLSVSRSQR